LATSRLSLNSPDLQDVAAVMEGFQTINKCAIMLRARVVGAAGACHLEMSVTAWDTREDVPEAKLLAFVNVNLGCGSHKTMEGAILWALYQLDWKLAELELHGTQETA